MNTLPNPMASIRDRLADAPEGPERFLWGATASVPLGHRRDGTGLGGRVAELARRSVLVATRDQFATALALMELDGIARRLIICTPDFPSEHLPAVVAKAGVDAIVSDQDGGDDALGVALRVLCNGTVTPATETAGHVRPNRVGAPHVRHDRRAQDGRSQLRQLDGAHRQRLGTAAPTSCGARSTTSAAMAGSRSFSGPSWAPARFVLSGTGEPIGDYLVRLGAHGATHVSGTPSHWRRALMSPEARAIAPRYIRLSGEIADQGILNALHSFYPQATVGHAFASTEAGVGFEVNDGLEGFPASIVGAPGDVQIEVVDGSLRIRSARNADRYVGEDDSTLTDEEGFVDTGDMVERRGDRYYFLGRRSGVINVGGLKVYPEEVEAAINRHPAVRMSMVRSRRSPITGSLVAADVVLKAEADSSGAAGERVDFKREILQICHGRLAPHKIPATIRFVPALDDRRRRQAGPSCVR